jgi:quinol monooxygenase YgiN
MVIVHARVPIKAESREQWLSIASAVAGPSRREEACRSYRLYEDLETPNSFIFIEEWTDLEALYRHFRTPHFSEFFGALPEVLAAPPGGSVHEVASTLTLDDALAAGGASA